MNSWLGLRIGGGGNLFLEINKTDRNVSIGDEKWCIISLEIKNQHLEFSTGGEIITNYEIKKVINNLKNLLDDKIEDTIILETLEPYLEFIFNKDNMMIKINFDLSKDYYCLYLNKYNIKQLYEYLNNIDLY